MWQVLGNDNCGCPCREYSVVKCDVEWVDHCYQHHYNTKCEKRQANYRKVICMVEMIMVIMSVVVIGVQFFRCQLRLACDRLSPAHTQLPLSEASSLGN